MGNCLFLAMPYTREVCDGDSQNDSNHPNGNRSLFDDFKTTTLGSAVVSPTERKGISSSRH